MKRKVFVQLYPRFFNEDTDWCDSQTLEIFPGPGYKPKLTKDLRHRLNRLAENLNSKIKFTINKYVKKHEELPHDKGGWLQTRMYYMDEFDSETYPGHRFCEEGKKTFDDEDIWFFVPEGNDSPKNSVAQSLNTTAGDISVKYDASTCKDDPRADTDGVFGWGCDLAIYIEGENVTSTTTMFAPESLVKTFHPKTAAFTEIYKQHKDVIRKLAYGRDKEVDQGILNCRPEHDDGDKMYYFSRENALQAIASFCEDSHQYEGNWTAYTATEDNEIAFSVAYDNPLPSSCPTIDHTVGNYVAMCKDRLGIPLENCE